MKTEVLEKKITDVIFRNLIRVHRQYIRIMGIYTMTFPKTLTIYN